MTFTCYSFTNVAWHKDGEKLRWLISDSDEYELTGEHELTLNDIDTTDAGVYKCIGQIKPFLYFHAQSQLFVLGESLIFFKCN